MSLASDLLDQASTLALLDPMKPKQEHLITQLCSCFFLPNCFLTNNTTGLSVCIQLSCLPQPLT